MKHIDILVIGAGPSGTVAASYLVNQGYNVTIIERTKFPRFVIGESLLPLSMSHYQETGLLPALEAQNFEVKDGALFTNRGIDFRISFDDNYTDGWTWAWQAPRDEFDKTLADEAEKKGVEILYQSTLNNIEIDEGGAQFKVQTPNGNKAYSAKFVIDSSGYGGVLSKMLNIPVHVSPTSNVATYTHFQEKNRANFPDAMQISFDILQTDLWLWVIPFSNGTTSLGFVGNRKYFDDFLKPNSNIDEAFNRMLKRSARFGNRFSGQPFKFTPKVHADYMRWSERFFGTNYVLTGNTTEFLDPVFSSGVAFATTSGLLAAKLAHRQLQGEPINWQKEYVNELEKGIDVFRTYVEEWYTGRLQKIFFHANINPLMKKQLTSVLAGYVWDQNNPFVRKHKTIIKTLAQVVDIEKMSI